MDSQIFLLYTLKTIIVSGLFYAYYWLVLRDNKFHYYNRFYLLSSLSVSFFIPFIHFNWFTVESAVLNSPPQVFSVLMKPKKLTQEMHLDKTDWVLIVMGSIAIGLLVLLSFNILRIYQIKRKSEVTKMDGFDFMSIEEEAAPFSFLNNLFWKKSISLNDINGQKIFKHEITHIQQNHTLDRLYCQIVSSIFWVNPFNWLIQKELQTIHEFIADEEAVGNSNVKAFAQMLLQTHYGNHFLNPSHSFFISSIKRRLMMLTTSKKTKYSYLRRVMVIPLSFLLMLLFSIQLKAKKAILAELANVTAYANILVEKPSIDTTRPNFQITRVNKEKRKVDTALKGIVSRVNKINPDFEKMKNAIIYLDGVEIQWNQLKEINPNDIATINVSKGENVYHQGGLIKSKEVVEIMTKAMPIKQQALDENWKTVSADHFNDPKSLVENKTSFEAESLVKKDGKQPLYVIDGVVIKGGVANPLDKILISDIVTISIIKDKKALEPYGKEGEHGVVLINTKKHN